MIRTNQQTFEAPPTLQGVRELRQHVGRALAATGLSEGRQGQVLVAVSELATNLVQHSNPRPAWVRVLLTRERSTWHLEIADNGGPILDWRERLNTSALEGEDFLEHDHGRGLALIASMFPDAQYRPRPSPRDFNRWLLRLGESNLCIALIDDDPIQLKVIGAYLAEHYQVVAFSDPRQALRQLPSSPPDLVLTDIVMPGMSGFELRQRLAEDHATELVPVIFLTGSLDEQLAERAAVLGIDDFLTKPIDKRQLLAAVRRTLHRSRSLKSRLGHRIDAAITEALRPRLPERFGHWRAAVRNCAADAGGGDFISFTQADELACMVLVDVMGHGVAAKFFAHAHAGYIGGMLHSRPEAWEPANLCQGISHRVFRDSLNQYSLLTCVAVRLGRSGWAEIACAGHPAPLLLDASGAHQLDIGGSLPGLQSEPVYDTLSLKLKPGERLMLFTDGLFEGARSGSERDDLEREVMALAGAGRDLAIDVLADRIMERFHAAVGEASRDDATLLLIEPAGD
jgi:CheY-like chemotaxis protein/anti-sigma regulatory factor (Ser/Thr protein kinase)